MRRCLRSPGLSAVAMTLALLAAPAQDRPATRPVAGLAAPQPLPAVLPAHRHQELGLAYTLLAGADGPEVAWLARTLQRASLATLAARGEAVVPEFAQAHNVVVGDFDGDGRDEFVARRGADTLQLLADLPPQRLARPVADVGDEPWCAGRAADWDGDGRADLAGFRGGQVLLRHDVLGGGTLRVLADLTGTLGPDTVPVGTVGDYDLDGLPDLVLALPQRGLVWCRNEGTRTAPRLSAPIPLWPETPGTVVLAIVLVPVDGDPWPDLVLATAALATADQPSLRVRMPRWRTAAEERALAVARAELATFEQAAARQRDGIAGLGPAPSDPFALLLGRRQHQRRVDALRWQELDAVALAPCVMLRTTGR